MEKVKEKEKPLNLIKLGECYGLNRAIYELSSSAPSLKGKIVYALSKNEAKLASILKKADTEQSEIIKKYVKLNKDGSFKLTEPTEEEQKQGKMPEYIYKVESDKSKAEKEVLELMEKEVDIDLHKIWKNDFDNIDISPARTPNIGLIIDYLVSDLTDMQLM